LDYFLGVATCLEHKGHAQVSDKLDLPSLLHVEREKVDRTSDTLCLVTPQLKRYSYFRGAMTWTSVWISLSGAPKEIIVVLIIKGSTACKSHKGNLIVVESYTIIY
jgi:hypothetical protein